MKARLFQDKQTIKIGTAGLVCLGIMVSLLLLFSSCVQRQPLQLDSVEVREYQGEKLSSISDFQENSIKGPQEVEKATYTLTVTGLVENHGQYTYDQIINDNDRYKKMVKLDCVEGWSVNILWEGILISDIVARAKALPAAKTIIFHAQDGYTTSFPIDYVINNTILLAYKMNDVVLPPERGFPFQVVAENKWGYKWIKWVTKIELSDDVNYKGYWEQRGYSNNGDLDKHFFE